MRKMWDALEVVAAGSVTWGAHQAWSPAGWIVGGVFVMLAARARQ